MNSNETYRKMSLPVPLKEGFTIFSKSGCKFCDQVKELLIEENKKYTVINCDTFLEENKSAFLEHVKILAGKECKTFPIVFLHGVHIGGFMETYKLLLKDEDSE